MSARHGEGAVLVLLSVTAVLLVARQLLTWSAEDGLFSVLVLVLLLVWAGTIGTRVLRHVRGRRPPDARGNLEE